MTYSMAEILKNVIKNGGMPLSQVNERIETMYLNGRLNAEERLELIDLMHSKASPDNEKGNYKALYETLTLKYTELESRVKAIEKLINGGTEGDDETDTPEAIPKWKAWDGVTGGYAFGDLVRHNEKVWRNMLEGMLNVWEPGGAGTDERYWMEIPQ